MKKDTEFNNILDECLEKMLRGKSIEQCLADYPDHASALEPMLRTAFRAKMATNIRPRPEFKDRARHEFQAAIRDMDVKPARSRGFFPSLKPAWIALAALVAVVIAGGGTVYAAGNALPDSPLYAVKLATESVRLFLTPSEIGKAELYAEFADERVEEIVRMADKGEVEFVQETTNRLNEQLVAMASLAIGENGIPTGGDMLALESTKTFGNGEEAQPAPPAPDADVTPATPPPPVVVTDVPEPDETAPLVTAERPPTPVTDAALSAASERKEHGTESEENGDRERREKLKDLLLRQAIENPEALEKALETAPESLRDIILWAIEVANAGYDEAINNLK